MVQGNVLKIVIVSFKVLLSKYINFEEMKPGLTGIEFGDRAYVFSLDNGLFTLGEPRKDDGMPQPEEQYL